jgi:acyl transferase domain-containing protein
MAEPTNPEAVAIVGLAGRFPGARGLDGFWRNIREGVESLETFSEADLDAAGVPPALRSHPDFVRKGTPLEEAEHFDAGFFGLSPREAQILDPQHRIFLECAWEALEHAGYAGGALHEAVGVYAGASMNTYLFAHILRDPNLVESAGAYQLMLGNDKDYLCTRVSYKLDLRGPSMTIQTACSTSLVAVEVACRALQRGECDLALAGGVSVSFPQRSGYLYQEGMIFSPDGHCRPFDADARGIRGGAGAGIVVLKRLADALADRDTIHAVILGAAVNNDGAGKVGYTAPSVDGQVEVIAIAQALARVDPRTISYVETHGTGTPLGDPIEIAALTQVFRASTPDVGFCRIGSLKANIGHLDAAAGVAGLIKTVLALTHREIPPLLNFRTPNPQLNLEHSPFAASARGSAWASGTTPRRAGVSSFGIGGTNAHVVLEEAPPAATAAPLRGAHLLVLSARTPTALEQATTQLADHLEAHADLSLADVEWTLQVGRRGFPHRRAVVVRDTVQAVTALRQPQRPPVLTAIHEGGARPVAFLFSGQGSQHAGMGAGLYRSERVYRAAVDGCAALLLSHLGLDVRTVLFAADGDAAINETGLTQPALFVTEYALASLWMHWGITPSAMMGHSIGEYVAAHLAGVMSLEDALAAVATRGRLMQALPAGSMAAVHLGEGELGRRLNAGVELAAVNAPSLCTVSGPAEAVASLLAQLEADGIESRALHTSHAFHSAMMEPALASFTEVLKGIVLAPPTIPYVSNVTGTWITPEQATSPGYYATHLRQAVRFEAGVRTLAADPALFFLEVGPGNTLTSLARMTVGKDGVRRGIPSLSHPREGRPDADALLEAAGRLWIAGATVDWQLVHDGATVRRVPLPTYPFERRRHWVEPSAARPAAAAEPPGDAGRLRRSPTVDDWLYAPTWTRDDSCIGRAALPRGQWLVLASAGPLSDAVMGRLKSAGAVPVLVEPGEGFQRLDGSRFAVRPGEPGDIAAVVRDLRGETGQVDGALYLWAAQGARAGKGDPPALSFHGLVALAAGLVDVSAPGTPVRIIVATDGAENVLDEPVRDPEAALMLGPVLVLPIEMPGLDTRAVDLALEGDGSVVETAALALVEEAAINDGERLVARRAGRRWVRRFERLALPPADATSLPLKPRGVYLITGGTGGIGLTLARWLAAQVSARLVLTARTAFPSRGAWDAWLTEHGPDDRTAAAIRTVRDIEGLGGEVVVATADAADPVAMQRAIEDTRARWGALDGVIHGAGVPGSGVIALRKQSGDVRAMIAPKVGGLAVLVRLLGDTPLDFVALLSSITSVMGAPGLSDFAAANAVLDAFVDSSWRPAAWRHVVAVDWGSWAVVGMAARLVVPVARRASLEAFLRTAIPPVAGTEAFARVLASGRRRVVVAPFDLVDAMKLMRGQGSGRAAAASGASAPTPPVPPSAAQERPEMSGAYEAPATDTERRLAEIWSELLGVERIGVHDDFFEIGGHSLLATRVLAHIDDAFGVRLALRDVFDAPTIHRLAERIGAAVPGTVGAGPVSDDDLEEIEL